MPLAPARHPLDFGVNRRRLAGVADRGGERERVVERQRLARETAAQRDPARQRLCHRADDRQVGRHAGLRESGANALVPMGAAEFRAGEAGKFEIVEENLHELLARQREHEVVLAVAITAAPGIAAAAGAGALRTGQAVAGHVVAVAGKDELAVAAAAEAEGGFGDVLAGDPDFAAGFHVGKTPLADHVLDRVADVGLVTPQKALPVDRALAAIVGTAIDQLDHTTLRVITGALTFDLMTICARADTTRPAAAPAFPYSPCRPCGPRSSGASACRRRTPWR